MQATLAVDNNKKISLPQVRCPHCQRLLFKGIVVNIEIKCPKCGLVHSVKNTP